MHLSFITLFVRTAHISIKMCPTPLKSYSKGKMVKIFTFAFGQAGRGVAHRCIYRISLRSGL